MQIVQIIIDEIIERRVRLPGIGIAQGFIISDLPEKRIKARDLMDVFQAIQYIQRQAQFPIAVIRQGFTALRRLSGIV